MRETGVHMGVGPREEAAGRWPMQLLQVGLMDSRACSAPSHLVPSTLQPLPLLPPPSTAHPHPTALTHPEVVEALGHAEMLGRNVCLKVLVETWLQGDEFGQWREVVHFFCG